MVTKHGTTLWGDMNYILWVSIFGNGGQGGAFNVNGEMSVSSLGIVLAQWFGSFEKWSHELYL